MSLSIVVGAYVGAEPDELRYLDHEFAAVNRVLRRAGLPEHSEPRDIPEDSVSDLLIGRPACLGMLRRVAASIALGKGLPEPAADFQGDDPILQAYEDASHTWVFTPPGGGAGAQLSFDLDVGAPPDVEAIEGPAFSHLLWHSDYCGYYLPLPLGPVLVVPRGWETLGSGPWIGSANSLLKECQQLAALIGYPRHLGVEALREQGSPSAPDGWRRYGVEAFTCETLVRACEASIQSGCAMVLC